MQDEHTLWDVHLLLALVGSRGFTHSMRFCNKNDPKMSRAIVSTLNQIDAPELNSGTYVVLQDDSGDILANEVIMVK